MGILRQLGHLPTLPASTRELVTGYLVTHELHTDASFVCAQGEPILPWAWRFVVHLPGGEYSVCEQHWAEATT